MRPLLIQHKQPFSMEIDIRLRGPDKQRILLSLEGAARLSEEQLTDALLATRNNRNTLALDRLLHAVRAERLSLISVEPLDEQL